MTHNVMENGELRPMTDQEQKDYDALQAAWPATQAAQAVAKSAAAAANPSTQIANLTAALFSANIIPATALPDAQITAVNAILSAIGQPIITSIAQPVVAAKLS